MTALRYHRAMRTALVAVLTIAACAQPPDDAAQGEGEGEGEGDTYPTCQTGCESDADCTGAGIACVDGICRDDPANDPAPDLCTTNEECIARITGQGACTASDECPQNWLCLDPDGEPGGDGECVLGRADDGCGVGVELDVVDVEGNPGIACGPSVGCTDGACTFGVCTRDEGCTGDARCNDFGRCSSCLDDDDCVTALDNGRCYDQSYCGCADDADCAGQRCDARGACVCDSDDDCAWYLGGNACLENGCGCHDVDDCADYPVGDGTAACAAL
jgi:hypothetical protein